MSYPEHPDTILFKNQYYPNGLQEIDVWNYYDKHKKEIIHEIDNKPVILFLKTNDNYIVKRKDDNQIFTLDKINYHRLTTGRTVAVSIEVGKSSDYICLDVDAGPSVSEDEKKECVKYLLKSPISQLLTFKKNRIISSGSGYHVYFYLNVAKSTNTLLQIVSMSLAADPKRKWPVGRRNINDDNSMGIDLAPLYPRGSHSVPYSLSRNGLICMDITDKLDSFKRTDAIVKKSWIRDAKTKVADYEEHKGLYTRKAEEIAEILLTHSDSPTDALRKLTFVINRSGTNINDERRHELEKAKIIIKEKIVS